MDPSFTRLLLQNMCPKSNVKEGIPEKASRTVTPRAIFSPESGGRQNTSTVSVDIIMHGKTMLYLEGRNGEGLNILKVHTCFQRLHESCLAQGAGLTPLLICS